MDYLTSLYQQFKSCGKVSTDTRNDIEGAIFFALSGENFNGNQFASDAIDKGAALAVIDQKDYKTDDRFLLVDNTLQALQDLARLHRSKLDCEFIGITGSNGKTTTKELMSNVLSTEKNVSYTKGNLNNHIGVPLTILRTEKNTEIAVIEMGANHIGEIGLLCDIARPNNGIITNIGKAHLEGFGSFDGVIKAKTELYDFLRTNNGLAFVNEDDPLLMDLSKGLKRITYGSNAAFFSSQVISTRPYITVRWHHNRNAYEIDTKLFGKYNLDNINAAIAIGLHFGISPENINHAIANYQPVNNRSQIIETASNQLIMDAYNANPVSMLHAIDNFKEFQAENPWLLLGDMFELGDNAAEEHAKIIHLIQEKGFINVMLVGKEFFKLRSTHPYLNFIDIKDAENHLIKHPIKNAQILVKGSRGVQLEKLLKFL